MKKGIFIKGELRGYKPGERREPTREIPGTKYMAEDFLEVKVWNATYTFKGNGNVLVTPHEQL